MCDSFVSKSEGNTSTFGEVYFCLCPLFLDAPLGTARELQSLMADSFAFSCRPLAIACEGSTCSSSMVLVVRLSCCRALYLFLIPASAKVQSSDYSGANHHRLEM